MAYENLQLVVAEVSGDIYLTKVKDGIMDTNYRRVATDDVLSSSTEWFRKMKNLLFTLKELMETFIVCSIQRQRKSKKILDILKGR